MKILVLSVNHGYQLVPLGEEDSEIMQKKGEHEALVKEKITTRNVDLICEESDPCRLSIAQQAAFYHGPRIPWKNINMTAQERLEKDIWEKLLYRPSEADENGIEIQFRIKEDDVREEFFKEEILEAAKETGAKSVLVLCGDMHTEALKEKLEEAGHDVETNRELTPQKHWE